jgi:hypothetical protein
MAEIAWRVLSHRCFDRRIGSLAEREREVVAWQARRTVKALAVIWRFTIADARITLTRASLSIPDREITTYLQCTFWGLSLLAEQRVSHMCCINGRCLDIIVPFAAFDNGNSRLHGKNGPSR